jgi:uncharacterized protein (TIGR03437 family)
MDAPAAKGETIVIYAYGLGQTTPPARTGEAAGTGLSILEASDPRLIVTVQDSFLNASPSTPRSFDAGVFNLPQARVDYAGLTPGHAGLYQINIPVPASFEVAVRCGPDRSAGAVRSNGVIRITTAQGTENVPICVTP